MSSKVLVLLAFAFLNVYGVTAKATVVELEEQLVDLLHEFRDEEKRSDLGNEADADNTNIQSERMLPGSPLNLLTAGQDTINNVVDAAFDYSRETLERDHKLKQYYFKRGGNIASFATATTSSADYEYTLLSEHGYVMDNRDNIILEVRACMDALIALKVDTDSDGDLYEIHIGHNKGTESSIRKGKDTNTKERKNHPSDVLDCNKYNRFMISWADHHIQVLHEASGWKSLIEWTDDSSSQLDITEIGFTTPNGVEGHWKTVLRGSSTSITTTANESDDNHSFELLQNATFNYPQVQEPHIFFEVQTCSNARLGLKEDSEKDGKLWEIAIDAERNGNTEIQIRRNLGGGRKAHERVSLLDCQSFQSFFVSWRNDFLQVFHLAQDGSWTSVIDWFDDKGRDVTLVGVYGDATWTFYDDYETGIDIPAGNTSSETMSALNDMISNPTELEIEENRAITALYATKYLLENTTATSIEQLKLVPGLVEAFKKQMENGDRNACKEEKINCNEFVSSPYRTIDGTCNNIAHPRWGSTGTFQGRLLPASYADKVNTPNGNGVGGEELPSARAISIGVLRDENDLQTPDDPDRTVMLTVMGQFFDHDFSETPQSKGIDESTIGCCTITDELLREERMQCNTIDIDPTTDPDFKEDTCMAFRRSLPRRGEHLCEPGIREQVNDITSYIDGSMVYGSTEAVANSLRTFQNGTLLVATGDLLPRNNDSTCVLDDVNSSHCFLAGDIRVNENPNLSVMHTAFVRYHNLLCEKLSQGGVTGDQKIYNIARKIVGAILQNILYGHWLPNVIGQELMDKYGLTVGTPFVYDATVDAGIVNGFAAAAFRYGHTLVRDTIDEIDESFEYKYSTDLKDTFFNPATVYSSLQRIARTFSLYNCKGVDPHFVPALKNSLFGTLDLSALNINRVRDHGLPSYTAYRKWAGLSVPTDFSDLTDHTPVLRQKLKNMFQNVNDIGLFTGGISETSMEGAHIGPLFGEILAFQFQLLKLGDRYFYERSLPEGFSQAQLESIKQVGLSNIFCEVFELNLIQENVFILPSVKDLELCETFPGIDISPFL
ncbi:peroxidasin-like [Ylistrum balloti]|uniref:peroxidasin-like n=1 Tax=Ylistrum balloti TaxID=509963 RepID=UPI002905B238|nr:peroxidasin-like [Ylistrum balloti]